MTSKLTRERLQEIAEDGFLKHGESKELARMALAAMDSEPVAWTWHHLKQWHVTNDEERARDLAWDGVKVEPLYRHAQPAPVVQCPFPCGWDNLNKLAIQDAALVARGLVEGEPTTEAHRQAAILNNDRLLKVISACRAAMLQAGNSPVIPEGYMMVPKEPTAEMIAAAMNCDDVEFNSDETFCVNFDNIYAAMVEAAPQPQSAPQNIPEIIPGWIPVSERMPEPGVLVLVYTPSQPGDYPGDVRIGFDYIDPDGDDPTYWFNHGENYEHFCCVACDGMTGPSEKAPYTHWIPLPAGPKEEK